MLYSDRGQTPAGPWGGGGRGGPVYKSAAEAGETYEITVDCYVMIDSNVFIFLPSVIHYRFRAP